MISRRDGLKLATAAAFAPIPASAADAAPTVKTPLNIAIPPSACDCHVHVFPDPATFPFAPTRAYTPPLATPDQLLALQRALHMDHVVIVTPSVYGTDNAATLEGMRQLGPQRARGIAVIDERTTPAQLDVLEHAGIRGIRINVETGGGVDPAASAKKLDTAVQMIRGRPWHLQMYARMSVVAELLEQFAKLPIPIVFDHFAGADAALGPQQQGFQGVIDLLKTGKAWVKISGAYRASKRPPDYPDVPPLARALIAAAPDQLVWGSDWPHPGSAQGRQRTEISPAQDVDDGRLLNLLAEWAPDEATRRKILVDNPKRLYGF